MRSPGPTNTLLGRAKIVLLPLFVLGATGFAVQDRLQELMSLGSTAEAERLLARDHLLNPASKAALQARLDVMLGRRPDLGHAPQRDLSPEPLVTLANAALQSFRLDPVSLRLIERAADLPQDLPGVPGVRAWSNLLDDALGWGRCVGPCREGDSVPLTIVSGLPLTRASVQGHQGLFIVDTGAATHALFRGWSLSQGLAAAPDTAFHVSSSGGPVSVELLRANLQLGENLFQGSPFVVLDSEILQGIAGIVSPQFLAWDGRVELALGEGALRLRERSLPPSPSRVELDPLWEGGCAYVQARLDDLPRGWFLVDTGASSTRLLEHYAGLGPGSESGRTFSAGGEVKTWPLPGEHTLAVGPIELKTRNPTVIPSRQKERGELIRDGILGLDLLAERTLTLGRREGTLLLDRDPRARTWPRGSSAVYHLSHLPGCSIHETLVDLSSAGAVMESRWDCGTSRGMLRVRFPEAQRDGWMLTRKTLEAWESTDGENWSPIDAQSVASRWRPLFVPFRTTGLPRVDLQELDGQICGLLQIPAEIKGASATFSLLDCPQASWRVRRVSVTDQAGTELFGFTVDGGLSSN